MGAGVYSTSVSSCFGAIFVKLPACSIFRSDRPAATPPTFLMLALCSRPPPSRKHGADIIIADLISSSAKAKAEAVNRERSGRSEAELRTGG